MTEKGFLALNLICLSVVWLGDRILKAELDDRFDLSEGKRKER